MTVPSPNDFFQGFAIPVPPVSNPPTYLSLQATRKALGALASEIPTTRGGGDSGYMGIVLPAPIYALLNPGHPFILPPNPGQEPVIPANPTAAVISAIERTHREALRQYQEYNSLHSALKRKLIAAVHPSFLQAVAHEQWMFTRVTLREMFQHLFDTYAHLDGIQIHANRKRLHNPWDPSSRFEDLVSHLQNVQELAADANRPIPNSDLIDAAFAILTDCGLYDDACSTWELRPAVEQTWPNLKAHFIAAQTILHRRRSRSTSNSGYTANAATAELEALVGQLVVNNENYMATARQEYASFAANNQQRPSDDYSRLFQELQNMKTELATYKQATHRPAARTLEKHDGYCWTHGFKVSKFHNSATCKHPATGHKTDATKHNMLGGSTCKSNAD
jgi:hypothetical protein